VILYLDTSAYVRACADEHGSAAARTALAAHSGAVVSSALLEVEVGRIAARAGGEAARRLQDMLGQVDRIDITRSIVSVAAQIAPGSTLRSLDAIHLATALALEESTLMMTYDRRLQDACRQVGLAVLAPA
jgi:predicted nucleic acid-binding protein